jgi:hypothetical protein
MPAKTRQQVQDQYRRTMIYNMSDASGPVKQNSYAYIQIKLWAERLVEQEVALLHEKEALEIERQTLLKEKEGWAREWNRREHELAQQRDAWAREWDRRQKQLKQAASAAKPKMLMPPKAVKKQQPQQPQKPSKKQQQQQQDFYGFST